MDKGRKFYSPAFPDAQPTITTDIPVPTDDRSEALQKPVNVTVCDNRVTGKKDHSVTVTLTLYVDYFRLNPDSRFTTRDLAQQFHVKRDAGRQAMSRVIRSGPVSKIAPGLFQYDPTKEQGNLHSVLRSGTGNLRTWCLSQRGHGIVYCHAPNQQPNPEKTKSVTLKICLFQHSAWTADPDPDSPGMDLPTGNRYDGGTIPNRYTNDLHIGQWRTTDKPGSTPVLVGSILKDHGFDPAKWDLVSVEYLIDSEKIRYEGNHTYRVFEKEVFKGYNHGYHGRFERASRR